MTGTWTALILAGSRPESARPKGKSALFKGHKGLMPVAGTPMVLRPLAALLSFPALRNVRVLTQQPEILRPILPDDPRVHLYRSEPTIAATIGKLIERSELEYPVLITTADHALLDRAMVEEFIAGSAGADLAIGFVERSELIRRFPQTKRTWIAFRGEKFSGANLFAFGSDKIMPAIDRWRSVEEDRKKGWRLLTTLGPALFVGAVLRLRTIDQSARSISRKLGFTIRPVRLSDPKAAIDVDKADDLALVEDILAGRA